MIFKIIFNALPIWNDLENKYVFQVTLGLLGSIVGVISLVGIAVNANALKDLSDDQDSICSAVSSMNNILDRLIFNLKNCKTINVVSFFIKYDVH